MVGCDGYKELNGVCDHQGILSNKTVLRKYYLIQMFLHKYCISCLDLISFVITESLTILIECQYGDNFQIPNFAGNFLSLHRTMLLLFIHSIVFFQFYVFSFPIHGARSH